MDSNNSVLFHQITTTVHIVTVRKKTPTKHEFSLYFVCRIICRPMINSLVEHPFDLFGVAKEGVEEGGKEEATYRSNKET